jgi:hypothetical protein
MALVALITPIAQKTLITQNNPDNTDSPSLIAVNITPIMIITLIT